MKNHFKKMILIIALVVSPFIVDLVNAQAPDTPGSGGSGGGQKMGGGGAPIGSGIALLLSLGTGYGLKKIYSLRKKEKE